MKILVTGGAGYIGSNLIKHLKKTTDAEITSLDNYLLELNKTILKVLNI